MTNDKYILQVREEATLLEFLLKALPHLSRNKVKDTLRGGGVRVNGRNTTQYDQPLKAGETVEVSKQKKTKHLLQSRFVKMVYEDRWLVVVEKNIGILSMAAGHKSLNIKAVLDDYFAKSHQSCRAHVVHRLDRDTSGLMVYAKDMETEQILERNWHDIVYDRRYMALLSGNVEQDSGTMASWLKDNKAYITYSSPVDNGGKYAVTHFRVIRRFTTEAKSNATGSSPSKAYTLAEFKLETGRKNQIRVHSADMGHPVCGDIKYGNGDDPAHRLCLHAYMLCFNHPRTGEAMEFKTTVPKVFKP